MADAKHYETDVAIIGSGGAGIAAGIEARDAGASVIAFEKAPEPGGAAIISGGGCCLVGTPLQKEFGIDDNPDLAFDDWVKWGGPGVDQVWAKYYIEHSLHDLYYWAESLGVKWVNLLAQEGNSVDRWTRPERNGLGLMTHLVQGFRSRSGEIILNTEINRLACEDDRVTGLDHDLRRPSLVLGRGGVGLVEAGLGDDLAHHGCFGQGRPQASRQDRREDCSKDRRQGWRQTRRGKKDGRKAGRKAGG